MRAIKHAALASALAAAFLVGIAIAGAANAQSRYVSARYGASAPSYSDSWMDRASASNSGGGY